MKLTQLTIVFLCSLIWSETFAQYPTPQIGMKRSELMKAVTRDHNGVSVTVEDRKTYVFTSTAQEGYSVEIKVSLRADTIHTMQITRSGMHTAYNKILRDFYRESVRTLLFDEETQFSEYLTDRARSSFRVYDPLVSTFTSDKQRLMQVLMYWEKEDKSMFTILHKQF